MLFLFWRWWFAFTAKTSKKCAYVHRPATHSWLLTVLILPWIRDTQGGTWWLSSTDRSCIPAKVNTHTKKKRGLSHSLFNWLHHWIIAEFFLGFSLVRTSRGTTSAIQRTAGRETDGFRERAKVCWVRAREKHSAVVEFEFQRETQDREQLQRERERHTHTHWGVCHSNLVPQGSTTQHYLKTVRQHWQKRCRRAVFWRVFGSAHGDDEGISLNQLAAAVSLRHIGERDLTQTRREGDSEHAHTHR